jgi:hypothetical protein
MTDEPNKTITDSANTPPIDDKKTTYGRTFWDIIHEWWRAAIFLVATIALISSIFAYFDLFELRYNNGWSLRLGISPQAREQASTKQAQKDKLEFLRNSRETREQLFKNIKGLWFGGYQFDDSIVSYMQRRKDIPSECRFTGAIYKIEVHDYDLSKNSGSVYLTVTAATSTDSPKVYYDTNSSRRLMHEDPVALHAVASVGQLC